MDVGKKMGGRKIELAFCISFFAPHFLPITFRAPSTKFVALPDHSDTLCRQKNGRQKNRARFLHLFFCPSFFCQSHSARPQQSSLHCQITRILSVGKKMGGRKIELAFCIFFCPSFFANHIPRATEFVALQITRVISARFLHLRHTNRTDGLSAKKKKNRARFLHLFFCPSFFCQSHSTRLQQSSLHCQIMSIRVVTCFFSANYLGHVRCVGRVASVLR